MNIVGVFTKMRPEINGLYFDALLEESSELVTNVSEYPLEKAETAHDNATTRHLSVTMTVAISDNWYKTLIAKAGEFSTLAGIAGSALGGSVLGKLSGVGGILTSIGIAAVAGKSRSSEALEQIREMQRNKEVMTIVGAKRQYENMLITSTRTTINKKNEGGLELVIDFVQLNIINPMNNEAQINANLPSGDTASIQGQATINLGEVSVS